MITVLLMVQLSNLLQILAQSEKVDCCHLFVNSLIVIIFFAVGLVPNDHKFFTFFNLDMLGCRNRQEDRFDTQHKWNTNQHGQQKVLHHRCLSRLITNKR